MPAFQDSALPRVEANLFSRAPMHPDFEVTKFTFALTRLRETLGTDSELVHLVLGRKSPEEMAATMIAGSQLADVAVRRKLWEGGAAAIAQSADPFIKLAVALDPVSRALLKRHQDEVESPIQQSTERIALARFARYGTQVYPDATSTIRLGYGKVEGWKEGDRPVPPVTRFGGAFERHTGYFPFALPPSWLAARDRLDPAKPLNLSVSTDTTGGSSGSPVLDVKGRVVGLLFDGNIHSLGDTYGYDARRNRSVIVDSGGMVEALGKIYGASALLDELAPR